MSQESDIEQNITQAEYAATSATGNAAIYIYNYTTYHAYHEEVSVAPVKSVETATNEKLPSPYRGLYHFAPKDTKYFFGREVFVTKLVQATQTRNFVPVLGASGSGKSSVVFAGLVPRLQQQEHWKFTYFRPGSDSDPFYALAEALVPLYRSNLDSTDVPTQAGKLAQSLKNGQPLERIFSLIQRHHPQHQLLLIADQFEEIYTVCTDEAVRQSFLDCLLTGIESSTNKFPYSTVLVATMRADFLGNALLYRRFADALQNADIKLPAMNQAELSQVIEEPARKLDVTFEAGLVELILADVNVKEPREILPLLEFALSALWKERTGKYLSHAAYEKIGRVQGALAKYADEKYSLLLNSASPEQLRRIFIQLVRPGEDTGDTRRQATKAELGEASWPLVKQLADARLVITSRNPNGQETVEVVHEALIQNWSQLRQWMVKDRLFRAWQERLRVLMQQWEEKQPDEGALLRGAVLTEAEEKLKQRREELSAREQKFIQASIALRQSSKQRIYSSLGGIGSIVLLAVGIWGWLNYTNFGQLTQIRSNLTDMSQQTNPKYQSEAAVAFAKDENYDQAFKLANQIQDSRNKGYALRAIVEAIGKLNQPKKAAPLLDKAITTANQIQDSRNKADALRAIAEAYSKLNQPKKAAPLLDKALASANQIQDSTFKVYALRDIVEAIGRLNQPKKTALLLDKAIATANQIQNLDDKVYALRNIVEAISKLNQPKKAALLLDKAITTANQIQASTNKTYALRGIAETIGKLNQQEKAAPLLDKVLAAANQIQDSTSKVYVLSVIAEAYSKLNQPEKAASLLDKAITTANQIQDSTNKTDALRAIVEAIGKLNQPKKAALLLDKAIASANQIQDSLYKADALRAITAIAETIGKLNQPEKAVPLLDKATTTVDQIHDDSLYKADALRAIVEAISKLNQPKKAALLLDKMIASANQIQDYRFKTDALRTIVEAISKLNQPEKAAPLLNKVIAAANQIQNPDDNKTDVLKTIVEAIGKLNQPEKAAPLLDKALAAANQIHDDSLYKADALKTIVEAIGKLNQPEKAAPLLNKVIAAANQIQDHNYKIDALRTIVEAISKLNQPEKAAPLLDKALAAANQIQDHNYKIDALRTIVEAISKLNQPEKAAPLLDKALAAANQIQDSSSKASALSAVAEAAANLKNWRQALKATQKCPSNDCKVQLLARVLTVHAEQQHPELKELREELKQEKEEKESIGWF